MKAIPLSLASSVKSTTSPTQSSGQVPPQGTREKAQPSTANWDAAQPDELAAVQEITQPPPPTSCATSGSISLMDSDEASVAGTPGGSSSTTAKKKQVGNIKLVPRSVSNDTQEPRMMLPNQVHSPSSVWSYHSNWSDDLSPHLSYHLLYLMVTNPSWG